MYLRRSEKSEYNIVSFNEAKSIHFKGLSFILKLSFFCECVAKCYFFYDMMMMVEGSGFGLFVLKFLN